MKLLLESRTINKQAFGKFLLVHHRLIPGEHYHNTMTVFTDVIGRVVTLPMKTRAGRLMDSSDVIVFNDTLQAAVEFLSEEFPQIDFTDTRTAMDWDLGDIYVVFPNDAWMIFKATGELQFSLKGGPLKEWRAA